MLQSGESARQSAAGTFSWLTSRLQHLLPRFLRWIPDTWIGFAIIGLTGFAIDIGVLTLLHGAVGMPYPIAVTLGYTVASIANFVLNRWLNFQVTGHIASQSGKQLVVVVSNYLIWILGLSTVLDVVGVQYQVARIISACVEGVYLYAMMRLWVFPRREDLLLAAAEQRPALEAEADEPIPS